MTKLQKQFRVAPFYRVSATRQRDQGSSIEAQRSTKRAAVARRGGRPIGESGGAEHAILKHVRAELARVIDEAVARKLETILDVPGARWARFVYNVKLARLRRLRKG